MSARLSHRTCLIGASICAALALVPGYYAVILPWRPRVDFDVLGVLWLLQNMPRLAAGVLAAVLGMAAAYFGVRALWSD